MGGRALNLRPQAMLMISWFRVQSLAQQVGWDRGPSNQRNQHKEVPATQTAGVHFRMPSLQADETLGPHWPTHMSIPKSVLRAYQTFATNTSSLPLAYHGRLHRQQLAWSAFSWWNIHAETPNKDKDISTSPWNTSEIGIGRRRIVVVVRHGRRNRGRRRSRRTAVATVAGAVVVSSRSSGSGSSSSRSRGSSSSSSSTSTSSSRSKIAALMVKTWLRGILYHN